MCRRFWQHLHNKMKSQVLKKQYAREFANLSKSATVSEAYLLLKDKLIKKPSVHFASWGVR